MPAAEIEAQAARRQLERVLASPGFSRNQRLARFLQFVVEHHLEGRDSEIKESVIALEVFGRGPDHDPKQDSIVRTEAARLRARLGEYYLGHGKNDALIIELPKGGYAPVIRQATVEPSMGGPGTAVQPGPAKRRGFLITATVVAGALLICAGMAWRVVLMLPERPIPIIREVPLTSQPGIELFPSFSPDGEAVAFVFWTNNANGEPPSMDDPSARVFLVSVKGGSARRLTRTEIGIETAPAWAPSSDQVALLGGGRSETYIYLVSALDGQARKILAVPEVNRATLSWSPDGALLTYSQRDTARHVFSIRTVSIVDGATRQLTAPPNSILGDADPAFSPDGRWIVFVRRISDLTGDLYLIPAGGGEARRLTTLSTDICGNAWMPDSNEIVFATQTAGVPTLRRIRIDDLGVPSPPRPLADIGGYGVHPTLIRPRGGTTALAYAHTYKNTNLWRADNPAPNQKIEFSRIAPSTRTDYDPSFSPDGSNIAFASNRSGSFEIWVCTKDGANPRQLTFFGGPDVGSPRWSPDGRHIAFDAQPGSNPDVYVVESDGGPIQRITSGPSDDARPSWSGDGRWIYFRSDRGGPRQIWRIPYTGRMEPAERAEQVTKGTAHEAFESPDGRWVYFAREPHGPSARWWMRNQGGLWRVPIHGGPEERILDGVHAGAWGLAESGIFFLEGSGTSGSRSFALVRAPDSNPAAKVVVANVDRQMEEDSSSFAVSRDGRSFLLVFQARLDSDLFLVNDFR